MNRYTELYDKIKQEKKALKELSYKKDEYERMLEKIKRESANIKVDLDWLNFQRVPISLSNCKKELAQIWEVPEETISLNIVFPTIDFYSSKPTKTDLSYYYKTNQSYYINILFTTQKNNKTISDYIHLFLSELKFNDTQKDGTTLLDHLSLEIKEHPEYKNAYITRFVCKNPSQLTFNWGMFYLTSIHENIPHYRPAEIALVKAAEREEELNTQEEK